MTKEVWKDVLGYEDRYKVSTKGNVYSKFKKDLMKPRINRYGYYQLTLYGKGKLTHTVHRLIALSFLENPDKKETVNHKDCNKLNNNITNLEFMSFKENTQHAVENNRMKEHQDGSKNKMAKLTEKDVLQIRSLISKKVKKRAIATAYKVTPSLITRIGKRKIWTHI